MKNRRWIRTKEEMTEMIEKPKQKQARTTLVPGTVRVSDVVSNVRRAVCSPRLSAGCLSGDGGSA